MADCYFFNLLLPRCQGFVFNQRLGDMVNDQRQCGYPVCQLTRNA